MALFDINTNAVKLRGNQWSALETAITAGGSAGDFLRPSSGVWVVGVLAADATAGQVAPVVYKADAIVLPVDLSDEMPAGTILWFENDTLKDASNLDNAETAGICAVLLETADEDSTEAVVELIGVALFLGGSGS